MRLGDLDALDKTIYEQIPIKVFGTVKRMAAMREIIQNAPTVDAVPVKHGRWVNSTTCSQCGWQMIDDVLQSPNYVAFNYCPNCGAKMDGGRMINAPQD